MRMANRYLPSGTTLSMNRRWGGLCHWSGQSSYKDKTSPRVPKRNINTKSRNFLIAVFTVWLLFMAILLMTTRQRPDKVLRKVKIPNPWKHKQVKRAIIGEGQGVIIDAGQLHMPSNSTKTGERIVVVTAAYQHIVDGVSLTLNRLVKWLLDNGNEVIVVAPTSPEPALDYVGNVLSLPSMSIPFRPEYRLSLRFPYSTKDALKKWKPTIVHITTPDIVGFSAQKWAKREGLPVVCSYHTRFNSYLPYYHLSWLEGLYWSLLRKFTARCDQMYVPSDTVEEELTSHGIDKGKIRTWARGVDTAKFSPERRSASFRAKVNAAKDEPIILLVSRIVWEKGLDVLVEVINGLNAQHKRFTSVIVGEGPARHALQKQMPHTIFMGRLTGNSLAEAYASSDIFLFPSHTETFGATTLEAMSSGLPVVVAPGPSNQIVVNETSGLIVPSAEDVESFITNTERLIDDAELRGQMGNESRQVALKKFQWETIFTELMSHYHEVLDQAAREMA